jgi:3-(3-hydroxy-phenyl)propionate hydroxylase
MRTAALGLAVRHAAVRPLINPRQTAPIAYADSPLNRASDDAFEAGPAPGTILPECPIAGGFVTALLDNDFSTLYFGEARDAPALPCCVHALPRSADCTGHLYPLYGATDGTLYLVRPDGHVLARWRDARRADVPGALQQALKP